MTKAGAWIGIRVGYGPWTYKTIRLRRCTQAAQKLAMGVANFGPGWWRKRNRTD